MYIDEFVFIGRDNAIALSLASDNVAIEHNNLTRCQVITNSTIIDSATSPALFDLSNSDRLILKFGQAGLTAGRHAATLLVFDAEHTNGLVWGYFVLTVK